MKYSVIVPYWNSRKWLDRVCKSLTSQAGDFEFLLVDDFSTDNGAEIVCEYREKDCRFVSLLNERSKGVSGARNTGLDWAKGDWITFVDADDEMLEDAGSKFDRTIDDDRKADIHQLNHVRYYTQIEKTALKYANDAGRYYIGSLPECWFGVWNKLFRADLVRHIRFNEKLQYGEDGLFVLECLTKTKAIHHADRNVTAVRHRFDNKKSLSHIKTARDLIAQAHAYEDFMLKQKDPEIRIRVCDEIAILWSADRMKTAIKEGFD